MHYSQSTDPVVVMEDMDSLVNSVVPSNTPEHETQFPHTVVPDIYNDELCRTSPISFGSDGVDLFPYFVEDKLKTTATKSGRTAIKSGITDIALVSDAHMFDLFESLDKCSPASPNSSSSSLSVVEQEPKQQRTQTSSVKESARSSGSNSRRSDNPGRNARMAKENRERKKKYVQGLENKVRDLEADKTTASSHIADLEAQLGKANAEIAQLQDMLRNQSSIAKVIASVMNAGSVSFAQPLAKDKTESSSGSRSKRNPNSADPSTSMQTRKRTRLANTDTATGDIPTVIPVQFNIHI